MEKRKFFVEPHILRFTEFDGWRSKKVLEIGCGGTAAAISLEVAQFIQGWSYQKFVRFGKKRFDVYGLKGTFYHGNAEQLSSF